MAEDGPAYVPPTFHVHVDAIVRRGDEILIMKRAMGTMTGAWYLPGGSLEHGETPEDGVRREVHEETGLEVDGLRLFRVWRYRASESAHAVGISYTCAVPPGTEPSINEEHVAFRWVDPAYYRERFFRDELLAALRDNPVALELVTAVRELVDAYIAERPAS